MAMVAMVNFTLIIFFGSMAAWYTSMLHATLHDEGGWAIIGALFFPAGVVRGSLIMMGVI